MLVSTASGLTKHLLLIWFLQNNKLLTYPPRKKTELSKTRKTKHLLSSPSSPPPSPSPVLIFWKQPKSRRGELPPFPPFGFKKEIGNIKKFASFLAPLDKTVPSFEEHRSQFTVSLQTAPDKHFSSLQKRETKALKV